MRDILKTIFVIIGTMIGAGFASGQEIYLFFNRYGTMGILGLIISCTLAGIIIYKVFQIVKNKKIHTYSEFLENISSNKNTRIFISIILYYGSWIFSIFQPRIWNFNIHTCSNNGNIMLYHIYK